MYKILVFPENKEERIELLNHLISKVEEWLIKVTSRYWKRRIGSSLELARN